MEKLGLELFQNIHDTTMEFVQFGLFEVIPRLAIRATLAEIVAFVTLLGFLRFGLLVAADFVDELPGPQGQLRELELQGRGR